MQIWFAHGSVVTLREQLVTQIILGILSEDLKPGERLPSTRELARRYRVHPNTISAGYRQLQRERWVEIRRGSGIYVCARRENAPSPALILDCLVGDLLRGARRSGIPLASIRSRLRQWLDLQPPNHFLLIEPDEELRSILLVEIQQTVTLPVKGCAPDDTQLSQKLENAIPVALPGTAKLLHEALPHGADLLMLQVRSVGTSLADWLPAPSGVLVAVVSRWPGFLNTGRTLLLAAGFDAESLIFRDARKPNWQRGLKETAAVVCDQRIATELRSVRRVLQFSLISEVSLAELRRYEQFVSGPLPLPT